MLNALDKAIILWYDIGKQSERGKRMDKIEKVIKGLEHEISRANIPTCGTDFIDCVEVALLRDAIALLKAQEPTQWHKEGCANNSSVCIVDIGNDMPALLAAVVVNGRFIFDGLDITEKVRHWFAIPGIKVDGQAVKWE